MKTISVLIVLYLFLNGVIFADSEELSTPDPNLQLTEQELFYIRDNPSLKVHVESSWSPFNFIEYGIIKGFSNDYIRLITQKSGLEIDFVTGYTWSEYVEMLKNHEIDIISNMSINAERKKFALFTENHTLIAKYAILVQKGNESNFDFENLKGENVAVVKDFFIEDVLRENYPEINLILTASTFDSIKQVIDGNAIATIDRNAVLNYLASKHLLSGINIGIIENNQHFTPGPIYMGIRDDKPVLKSIIDKAMLAVSDKEMEYLKNKWINITEIDEGHILELTPEEKEYLTEKGKLTFAVDPSWFPLEFIDKEVHAGISADFLALLKKRIGIPVELVPTTSWDQSIQLIKSGKVDFLPMAAPTDSRREFLDFTRSYYRSPFVLITKESEQYITDFNKVFGRTIGIVKNYAIGEILKNRHHTINFVEYTSIEDGLNDVKSNVIYGFIDSLEVAGCLIKDAYPELRISGDVNEYLELSIATRFDEPILNTIFEKGIDSISIVDRERIIEQWITVDQNPADIPWPLILGLIILFILVSLWSFMLRLQVKRKTRDLEQSETKYRTLYESSLDAIFLLDPDEGFLDCNPATLKMFVITAKQNFLKLSPHMISPDYQPGGESSEKLSKQFIKKALSDGTASFNWVHKRTNGEEFPATVKLSRVKVDERTVLQGTMRDISEQKQAEDALVQLRNYLENIINSMPSIIIGIDKEGIITQWNSRAEETTGISAENALNKKVEIIYPHISRHKEVLENAIATNKIRSLSKQTRSVEGITLYENFTFYPLIGNEEQGAVIRIDDITERVKFENAMIQSEKMVSIGGLAAGTAHEINNPLAAITQNIQNVLRRLEPSNIKNLEAASRSGIDLFKTYNFLEERKIIRYLESSKKSVDKAASIIKNMLVFSRSSKSNKSDTNLADLINHTIELGASDYDMKKKYDFKFVEIIKEYDPDTPSVICCQSEIEQVLLNLFKNSIQAMEEIDTSGYKPCIHIRLKKDRDFVRIEIEDNGPGIKVEIKSRIFEPFFTTKPIGTGTGLGLSVSYTLITQNNEGTFEVESEIGKGATFIIRLPISR